MSEQENDKRRERDKGAASDTDPHTMGGDVGAVSGRGSGVSPGPPYDEEHHGEIVDDGPDAVAPPVAGAGHVGGDLEWVPSDEDDPDAGSGRTDADDGGYLPGEGTGRPPGE